MIKKELTYFLTALMFFTRIPVSSKLQYSSDIMNNSQKYYPMIGIVVGLFNAVILYVIHLVLPFDIALIIMMIAGVLLTGGFHEDGFIDVCDSFGGGYGKEKILTIMKDSRVGAYGAIGIVLLFLLKYVVMKHLAETSLTGFLVILIIAHSTSRYLSGLMIHSHQYVADTDLSKSKPMANKALSVKTLFMGMAVTLLPYFYFQNLLVFLVLPFAYLGKAYLGWYFKKHIGGYTGDCLGTVQQVTEVLVYLGFVVLWKYI